MSLRNLREYIDACFTGIWIETDEPDEAIQEVRQLAHDADWTVSVWDIAKGFAAGDGQEAADPLSALELFGTHASHTGTNLLVLRNYHRFLGSPELIQQLSHQLTVGKQHRNFILIVAPVVDIPIELRKQFLVLQHELPDREKLLEIATEIGSQPGELPEGTEREQLLDAASGLTRQEAESAFALSLVREGKLTPAALWELKTSQLKQNGLLELYRGTERFDQLGGLNSLKQFCARTLQSLRNDSLAKPKGVLLLGVPGTGKSQFAKALGNETGRPTLQLDIGRLMGSLVGESERNIRQALSIAEAMAPCVLFIDEIEKGLSGVQSGNAGDSGVSTRLFGYFLTWLNDHQSDVYVIATCNDISRLPPEFSRSERFDGLFFLDLPDRKQREQIWEQYLTFYQLDPAQPRPEDQGWTGAEIKSACRLAALLEVSLTNAALHVVPVAHTAREKVTQLQQWASGRCLSAESPGIYQLPSALKRRRSVPHGDPSLN
ncbi:MAG: AAA family ATPase [Planctomyces sp.]|nr:AAA family ATPase [Planctomyces sp.]